MPITRREFMAREHTRERVPLTEARNPGRLCAAEAVGRIAAWRNAAVPNEPEAP
ncbi:MAG: hypothetical protein AMXMBFR64_20230 [Myxococcales bacterium]